MVRFTHKTLLVRNLKPPRSKDYSIVVIADAARQLIDMNLSRLAKHLSHAVKPVDGIMNLPTQMIWLRYR